MNQPEQFHTLDQYQQYGLERFLGHVQQYLEGQRTIPVCQTNQVNGFPAVRFTFSNDLFWRFIEDIDSIQKPLEVALKYGFRGYSRGGQNGIFLQHPENRGMERKTERLALKYQDEIIPDLETSLEELDNLRKIKIVSHDPSGARLVGIYNPSNHRAIFLDFASY